MGREPHLARETDRFQHVALDPSSAGVGHMGFSLVICVEQRHRLDPELPDERQGEDIDQILLFGSRANGTAREYSDYDILLVVKKSYDRRFEDEIHETCYDMNLKYDILIDVKIISREELHTLRGKQPFIQNALNVGISL